MIQKMMMMMMLMINSRVVDVIGPVIYVSGEENSWQVASQAAELGIQGTEELLLLCNTDFDSVANVVYLQSLVVNDDDQGNYLGHICPC
jgi:predicted ATP-dependent serine protease